MTHVREIVMQCSLCGEKGAILCISVKILIFKILSSASGVKMIEWEALILEQTTPAINISNFSPLADWANGDQSAINIYICNIWIVLFYKTCVVFENGNSGIIIIIIIIMHNVSLLAEWSCYSSFESIIFTAINITQCTVTNHRLIC